MEMQPSLILLILVMVTHALEIQASSQANISGTILEQNSFLLARIAALEAAQLTRSQDDKICQSRLSELEGLRSAVEQHDVARGNWMERLRVVQNKRADDARHHKEEVRRLEQLFVELQGATCNATALRQACQSQVDQIQKQVEEAQEQAAREERHHNQTQELWEKQLQIQEKACTLKVELATVRGSPSTQDPCESSNNACGAVCNDKFKAACSRFTGIVAGLRAQLEECKKGA